MSRILTILILCTSALVTACGGGSDANIPGPSLPVVVAQPADQSVLEGATATLSADAAGAGTLTYQWQFSTDGINWTSISGATGPTYTTGAVTASMNGNRYRAIITNALGSTTTSAARLTVTPSVIAPQITVPPANQTVTAPATATFTVTTTGTSPTYRWQLSTDGGTTYNDVAGATTATLTVTGTTTAQSGHRYRVVVSNSAGSVTSAAATLTVNPTPVAPAITGQPASRTITAGANADFIVVASGTPAPGYQWRLGSTNLSAGALGSGACAGATVAGATTATLTLTNVPIGCSGATFSVVVSNGVAPDATSATATLTVNPAPVAPGITTQPALETVVTAGATATFTSAASGVPSPTVQWQVSTDGGASYANIAGATSGSYTTPATVPGDEGRRYRLVATNSQGSANSAAGVLYVYAAPTVTNPVNASVIAGQTATFSVTVTGAQGAAALQWQRAEAATPTTFVDIAGATGASYTTPATVAGDHNARFRVRWSNSSNDPAPAAISNSGTSNAATLTVQNAITATQVVAGYEWSIVRRPDGTVWAWGWQHNTNGTVSQSVPFGQEALRPVQMYPSVLTSVRAVAGWYDGWYALMEDGRVLHWGNARNASDGRGTDGNGSLTGSVPQFRYNAAPVEMLEIVSGTPQPVNRVCSIAATQGSLIMIRSIDDAGATTSCNPGAAKTVWWVGTWTASGSDSTRVVVKIPGLPQSGAGGYSPPSVVVGGQSTSGDPPLVIGLEDGRAYGIGQNFYNGFGLPTPAPSRVGNATTGPQLLPAAWGSLRGFGFSFYYSLFGIRTDGTVFTSGYSGNTELGTGDVPAATYNGPLQVIAETCTATPCTSFLTGVDAIVSTNSLATLALRSGQIYGWGRNLNGLLGLPAGFPPAQVPYPRLVTASVAMTAISASNIHALAIGPGNAVYSWGSGLRGALGDGVDGNTRTTPQLVTLP